MKHEITKSRIIYVFIMLIVLLIVSVGAILGTKPCSMLVHADGEMTKLAPLEQETAMISNNSIDLSWSDFKYLALKERAFRSKNIDVELVAMKAYLEKEIAVLTMNKQDSYSTKSTNSDTYEIFGKELTVQEILLFVSYPTESIIAYSASLDAIAKGPEFYNNDNLDYNNPNAFRHAYWNALMVERLDTSTYPRTQFAQMFADAHEYGQSGFSTEMDYINNAQGRADAEATLELYGNSLSGISGFVL